MEEVRGFKAQIHTVWNYLSLAADQDLTREKVMYFDFHLSTCTVSAGTWMSEGVWNYLGLAVDHDLTRDSHALRFLFAAVPCVQCP